MIQHFDCGVITVWKLPKGQSISYIDNMVICDSTWWLNKDFNHLRTIKELVFIADKSHVPITKWETVGFCVPGTLIGSAYPVNV